MTTAAQSRKTRDFIVGILGAFACTMGIVAAIQPDIRVGLRASLLTERRSVLSTAQGPLMGDATTFTVAKIRSGHSIFLEIYQMVAEGQTRFVDKIQLPDSRDGFFSFNGRATNLAIADLNGDGHLEILAPTFDDDLVGRLNVFRYDPSSGGFQRTMQ